MPMLPVSTHDKVMAGFMTPPEIWVDEYMRKVYAKPEAIATRSILAAVMPAYRAPEDRLEPAPGKGGMGDVVVGRGPAGG